MLCATSLTTPTVLGKPERARALVRREKTLTRATMAEVAQDSGNRVEDIESQIKAAILSRSSYFQDQADSLTFEGVRRLLEKDLGFETHSLDSHKRFVKRWLQNCIESAADDKMTKSEGTVVSSTEGESVNQPEAKKENLNSEGEEIMKDSPVMGLLTGPKKVEANANGAEEQKIEAVPSEPRIKKAIWERASYLKENSQSVTLAGLRQLLEEDLGFEKHGLDPFKKFISQQVDEVLNSPESPPKTVIDKKKTGKKDSNKKIASKSSKEEAPTTSGDESDDVSEKEVKVRKKPAVAAKLQKSAAVKKRKRPEEDSKGTKRKQIKASKSLSEESGNEDSGDVSEDNNSESSAEKPVKKKEVPKSSYGKQVEHLRSVIKSCGMSVPPVVYKKVKQAPENKRESYLIKELEEILSKEGLSTNPSEKDIKEVKKRKERTKELEGIDMSNIVVSSRRRSTTSFAPPPKPKVPDISECESEESEDEVDEDDDDEEVEVEVDEEVDDEETAGEDQEDGEDGGDGSQSEESNQGGSDSD